MRFCSRVFLQLAVITTVLFVLQVVYKIYFSIEKFSKKSPVTVTVSGDLLEKAQMDLNLFKNVENRFEDMYNFNMGLKSLLVKKKSKKIRYRRHDIEIWGMDPIAEYLWSHVLEANLTIYANGHIKHGEALIENLYFRFRMGLGIIRTTVPTSVKNLVLVLNGRDKIKIKFIKRWLDYLVYFKKLKNVALVILGDEKCDNEWILPYLKTRGGIVDFVFVVYDTKLVDNREFYQWPLGVAIYRGFPFLKPNHVNAEVARRYLCNFLGTVYKNTSREVLSNTLRESNKCFVASRDVWVPEETYQSMRQYINTLRDSDLTLNPAGKNTECYRIYEALSLGSVPVVENVVTPGNCDNNINNKSPLRLLKEYNAPLIFLNNWKELDKILEAESKLTLEKKVERRKKILKWYDDFKVQMKSRFVRAVKKHFFKEE